jgi:hypothetical protein
MRMVKTAEGIALAAGFAFAAGAASAQAVKIICHKTACGPGSQPRPGSIIARAPLTDADTPQPRAFRGTDAKEFPIL